MSTSAMAAHASSASFVSQYIFYIAGEPAALPWHSIPEDCSCSSAQSSLAIYRLPQPTKMTPYFRAWYMHACRAQWLGQSKQTSRRSIQAACFAWTGSTSSPTLSSTCSSSLPSSQRSSHRYAKPPQLSTAPLHGCRQVQLCWTWLWHCS